MWIFIFYDELISDSILINIQSIRFLMYNNMLYSVQIKNHLTLYKFNQYFNMDKTNNLR